MLTITKNKLDPADYDIIIASDLCNHEEDFYTLTFKMALDEVLKDEYLEACKYEVGTCPKNGKKLLEFIGWTKTKVIFAVRGMFYEDSFLTSVPRNF